MADALADALPPAPDGGPWSVYMADGVLDEASGPPTSRRRGTVAGTFGAEERSAIFEAESVSQVSTGFVPAVAPETR